MEVRIAREPKGGPDVIFAGNAEAEKRMLLAGDYLSVRGFTARIVVLTEGGIDALSQEEREKALSGGAPLLSLLDASDLRDADAAELAKAALQEIRI